jgi:hypothetical protein
VPYLALWDLANLWARADKIRPEAVLLGIADWAVNGGFPPGTFVDQAGEAVDVCELWLDIRAALTRDGWAKLVGGETWWRDTLGARQRLGEIRVSRESVLAFCEATGTLPPPMLLRGTRRLRAIWKSKYRSPPPCPDVVPEVTRYLLEQDEAGKKAWTAQQQSWQPPPRRLRPQSVASEQPTLPLPEKPGKSGGSEKPTPAPPPPSMTEPTAVRGKGTKKRRGRPPGSGSLETSDDPLVDEMHIAIEASPGLARAAAAEPVVSRAGGAGDKGSKIRRLVARYREKYPD